MTYIQRPARRVRVELHGDSWCVVFVDRRKHQKYYAATFYAPDHSRESVEKWVMGNPKLVLTS
jgi:hypothetical protein